MSSLKVFQFEAKNVRILIQENELWWVLNDVCDSLDISNSRDVAQRLEDDEKDEVDIADAIGRMQLTTIVNESGLYELVFTSRKPEAKRFKRWLKREVLPSIRKTGSYSINQTQEQTTVKDEIDALSQCLSIAGIDLRLVAGVALNHAGTRMPQLKRAVEEGHSLLASAGQNDLLLTPTRIGKELGVSGRRVNEILTDIGYQVKNAAKKSKTEPDYIVTETGKPYAGNTFATGKLQDGKPDNTTYQHLKWKEEVIDIIRGQLAA